MGRVIPFRERDPGILAGRCLTLLDDAKDLREQLLRLPKPHRNSSFEYMVESTSARMLLNDVRRSLNDLARVWPLDSDQARDDTPPRAEMLLDIERALGLTELRIVLLCSEACSSESRLDAERDLDVLVPRLAEALSSLPQVMGVPARGGAKLGPRGRLPPTDKEQIMRRRQGIWRANSLGEGPHAS